MSDTTEFEFVPLTDRGRRFRTDVVVRLDHADVNGALRVDGIARFLQDVATDDSNDADLESDDTWVVRRTNLRLVDGARWPRYLDRMALTTWCGGVGAAWAERRTNIEVEGKIVIEAAGLWVPIDSTGHPVRLRQNFFDVYGEVARERRVSGRVTTPSIPDGAQRRPWPLRVADLDIIGHVNNAAVWQAVSDVALSPLSSVSVTHHASIEYDDDVTLVTVPGLLWLVADDLVMVSAQYSLV